MPISHTPRSLKRLRDEGYVADVVERWLPKANVRRDLFGMFDIVAVGRGHTVGVQVTGYTSVALHRRTLLMAPALAEVRAAGWHVQIHGWRKVRNRWTCRVVDLTVP